MTCGWLRRNLGIFMLFLLLSHRNYLHTVESHAKSTNMQVFICYSFTCAGFFLLAFIAFFNPVKVNLTANKWFGIFLFSLGCMVLNAIIYQFGSPEKYSGLIAFNELSRFLMAPALYL